jgi:uncharacterized protein YeaO (DUF488 family)
MSSLDVERLKIVVTKSGILTQLLQFSGDIAESENIAILRGETKDGKLIRECAVVLNFVNMDIFEEIFPRISNIACELKDEGFQEELRQIYMRRLAPGGKLTADGELLNRLTDGKFKQTFCEILEAAHDIWMKPIDSFELRKYPIGVESLWDAFNEILQQRMEEDMPEFMKLVAVEFYKSQTLLDFLFHGSRKPSEVLMVGEMLKSSGFLGELNSAIKENADLPKVDEWFFRKTNDEICKFLCYAKRASKGVCCQMLPIERRGKLFSRIWENQKIGDMKKEEIRSMIKLQNEALEMIFNESYFAELSPENIDNIYGTICNTIMRIANSEEAKELWFAVRSYVEAVFKCGRAYSKEGSRLFEIKKHLEAVQCMRDVCYNPGPERLMSYFREKLNGNPA